MTGKSQNFLPTEGQQGTAMEGRHRDDTGAWDQHGTSSCHGAFGTNSPGMGAWGFHASADLPENPRGW